MKITTKYNIRDKVWAIINGGAKIRTIEGVSYEEDFARNRIQYKIGEYWVNESRVFTSKEELINSL